MYKVNGLSCLVRRSTSDVIVAVIILQWYLSCDDIARLITNNPFDNQVHLHYGVSDQREGNLIDRKALC